MTHAIESYPNIRKAYLIMSYDNGGINVARSETDALAAAEQVIANADAAELRSLDEWIGTLSDAEVDTLVSSEETEMLALWDRGPKHGDGKPVADIFDPLFEVC